jgi:hypothetical protein
MSAERSRRRRLERERARREREQARRLGAAGGSFGELPDYRVIVLPDESFVLVLERRPEWAAWDMRVIGDLVGKGVERSAAKPARISGVVFADEHRMPDGTCDMKLHVPSHWDQRDEATFLDAFRRQADEEGNHVLSVEGPFGSGRPEGHGAGRGPHPMPGPGCI